MNVLVSRGHHTFNTQTEEVLGPFGDVAIERAKVQFDTKEGKRMWDIK